MYDKHGIKPFLLLFSKFEKEYGPLTADDEWKDETIIAHFEDNDDYY